jgi:hypothetical protein
VPDGRVNGPAGLDRAQLASLTHGGPGDACWTDPAEAALIAAADQLHDGADIDDPGWAALAAGRTPAQLVDVLLLAGWYHARQLRGHRRPGRPRALGRRLRRLPVGP